MKYNFTAGLAPAFLSQLKQVCLQANVVQNVIMFMFLPEDHSCVVLPLWKKLYWAIKLRPFTIVSIPIPGNPIELPILWNLVPDGANSFIHLMSECVNEEVRIGQRVTALET